MIHDKTDWYLWFWILKRLKSMTLSLENAWKMVVKVCLKCRCLYKKKRVLLKLTSFHLKRLISPHDCIAGMLYAHDMNNIRAIILWRYYTIPERKNPTHPRIFFSLAVFDLYLQILNEQFYTIITIFLMIICISITAFWLPQDMLLSV